ncbi:CapA family protein [Jeotgalibacillus soli]|uniref:Capsule synthesis protein CapA domain-containing protein n=1 Tax=Jeotgalibacillus soli TaxID=889306 RepID=A0A0C2VQK8_9BACL|nr:CapA family protein [Jeotgalibacillus soli]KIL46726.1 hypothetical protein KP78_18440 [Jeotgalibacillus soli]
MISTIRLAAVGDITLWQKPGEELFRSVWDSADVRIGNLEAPLTDSFGAPAEKQARLYQPIEAGEWIKELNPTVVALANNHTMDWGPEGLFQTCDELKNIGVKFAGGGRNIDEAIQPVYVNVKNHKIAFLSCSATLPPGFQALKNRPGIAGIRVRTSYEIEPSIDYEQPGTPPWVKTVPYEADLIILEEAIQEAYQVADFVIVAIHWGVPPQWCTPFQGLIAEYQTVVAQRLADVGVDLIIGHHAHAPYGMEIFKGKDDKEVPVLYSLGNYISHYDYIEGILDLSSMTMAHFPPSQPENRQTSLANVELTSANGRLKVEKVKIQPAVLNPIGETVETSNELALEIANRLNDFSNQRGAGTFIEDNHVVWKNTE